MTTQLIRWKNVRSIFSLVIHAIESTPLNRLQIILCIIYLAEIVRLLNHHEYNILPPVLNIEYKKTLRNTRLLAVNDRFVMLVIKSVFEWPEEVDSGLMRCPNRGSASGEGIAHGQPDHNSCGSPWRVYFGLLSPKNLRLHLWQRNLRFFKIGFSKKCPADTIHCKRTAVSAVNMVIA